MNGHGRKRRETVWYIEPFGGANEVLARELDGMEASRGVVCSDGMRRDVWRCPDYAFVRKFMDAATSFGLEYRVWKQEGGGSLRPAPDFQKLNAQARRKRQAVRQNGCGQRVLF